MSEPGPTPAPEALCHLAQLGRGEVETYRRALESRGVAAFVVPLRECDGPTWGSYVWLAVASEDLERAKDALTRHWAG